MHPEKTATLGDRGIDPDERRGAPGLGQQSSQLQVHELSQPNPVEP